MFPEILAREQCLHVLDGYAGGVQACDDGSGVAAWRKRMNSPHGKAVYKRRSMGECINARFRQWDLRQFLVRGRLKVQAVLSMFALANNILQGHRLTQIAA